jgi:tetratricopeptide (TPR) repeat protein
MRIKLSALLALLFITSGCVYYNTFYNAEKYFREAQEMELNSANKPENNAIQKYKKVIKKCGIVLEYYEGSKYADDALLLMAKSFFYIGRNYTQTISTLEDMIKFYPESELIAEAKLYIARAYYESNQEEKTYDLLHEFLLDNDLKDHHPQALQILANYKLQENDYVQTDYYLNKLIEEYPDSDEYEKAFFLQGKSQNEANIYDKSNEIFLKLLKSKVTRKTKFDAKYYIALNYLLLGDYQQSLDYATKLIKDEYRENMISRIRLIQARDLAELNDIDDAIALLEAIIEDNKRTNISASAYYFLGDIHFHKLKEYSTAIEFYNKVKDENRNSEYLEDSVFQSAIASQIIQYYNPNTTISAEDLINQQFKLAEFYIEYLDMPDSALIVYNNIIQQESRFKTSIDTLQIQLDSLIVIIDSLEIADSLLQVTILDSFKINKTDSLLQVVISDSLKLVNRVEEIKARKLNLLTEYNTINLLIENAEENIILYKTEFVPFAKLTKLWLHKKVLIDSIEVDKIYNQLLIDYPDNKYSYAAEMFMAGQDSIVVTTRKHIYETAEYNDAISHVEIQPEKTVESLLPIANDIQHEYSHKALFSLGYINYFLLSDSLSAKPYFDSVLASTENSQFKTEVSKFYDGENFIKLTRLPYLDYLIQTELDKEKAEQEEDENIEDFIDPEKEKDSDVLQEEKKGDTNQIYPVKGKD